ncbi:MAG: hypothetical protein LLG44_12770 [Chloroflexi bacterium]|nr:hypothetical protein [Chloroflexota bacterium]
MLRKEWLNGLWAPDGAGGSGGAAGSAAGAGGNDTTGGTTGGDANNTAGGTGGSTNQPPASFEAFMESQSAEVKALYEGHTKGLKSALEAERTQRSDLAKQLRDAASKAEAGSAAQKALQELQAKYEALDRKSAFIEESIKPEIGCADSQLAYLAALEIGAISEKGRADWAMLKERFPLLFRPKTGNASAGVGTQGAPGGKFDMNAALRKAAGLFSGVIMCLRLNLATPTRVSRIRLHSFCLLSPM